MYVFFFQESGTIVAHFSIKNLARILQFDTGDFTACIHTQITPRNNQAAHSCDKYASLQDGSFSWDAKPPAFLVQR
jgi:hypothetical protein